MVWRNFLGPLLSLVILLAGHRWLAWHRHVSDWRLLGSAGGRPPADARAQQLQARESERARIKADLRRLEIVEQAHTLDPRKISDDLESSLVDWRGLLRANVQQARRMLRKLMLGRLVVTRTRPRQYSRLAEQDFSNRC